MRAVFLIALFLGASYHVFAQWPSIPNAQEREDPYKQPDLRREKEDMSRPKKKDRKEIEEQIKKNKNFNEGKDEQKDYEKEVIEKINKVEEAQEILQIQKTLEEETIIIDKDETIIDPTERPGAVVPPTGPPAGLPGTQTEAGQQGTETQPRNTKRRITGPTQYDSRVEIRSLNPSNQQEQLILTQANSVGLVVEKDMIHQISDSIYQLDISNTLGSLYNLCAGEAFREQVVVGSGTAFIIGEQLMITAVHVFTRPIEDYVVVFGFELINKVGAYEAFIPAKDIYYPRKISYHSEDSDVVVFSIDRPADRPALRWASSQTGTPDVAVYMVGHPMGLPKKAALNAHMGDNKDLMFFYTTLDAFQGNSGSPVFRFDTHEVIGILVSGELDYKWNGSCNASTLCALPYCKGEKVMRIEKIMSELPQR